MSEMNKLDAALTEMGIQHTYDRNFDGGTQIIVEDGRKRLWDAVCTRFSYGGKDGLLELYGKALLGNGDVKGWLTADDVIELVKKAGACHV